MQNHERVQIILKQGRDQYNVQLYNTPINMDLFMYSIWKKKQKGGDRLKEKIDRGDDPLRSTVVHQKARRQGDEINK